MMEEGCIFFWCVTGMFFKGSDEIAIVCKARQIAGFSYIFSITEHGFCSGNTQKKKIVKNSSSGFFLKYVAEMVLAE